MSSLGESSPSRREEPRILAPTVSRPGGFRQKGDAKKRLEPSPVPLSRPQPVSQDLALIDRPDQRIRGSSYSLAIVLLGLLLMLRAATSLRAAAAAIDISEQIYRGRLLAGPAHNTVRNHLLRLGLYEINRAKAVLSDWIWVVDHTIQVGNQLCMVVLGIPLSRFQQLIRPLRCEDMEVLELLPMEKSNGELMGSHFVDLAGRYGQPAVLIADEGSDINGGFRVLCANQSRTGQNATVRSIDIVHKMSRLVKAILDKDEKWSEYRKQSCATGNRLRQSPLAHLTPPKPKTKARHMNLNPEIQWGVGVLRLLDGIDNNEDYDDTQRAKLRECAGWLANNRAELSAWSELMSISLIVCDVVRREGYSESIAQQVAAELGPAQHSTGVKLIEGALSFLRDQQSRCNSSMGKIPGSSEVIESLFGRGKRLEGQQSRSGFTAQLLSMAACVCEPTEELIREAFATVNTQCVSDWQKEMLGTSVQARRRRDLGKNHDINLRNPITPGNPNFSQD